MIVSPDQLQQAKRIACLSQFGVNLLLQRWIQHNSRVVVPTEKIDEATVSQFDEADLIEPDLHRCGLAPFEWTRFLCCLLVLGVMV